MSKYDLNFRKINNVLLENIAIYLLLGSLIFAIILFTLFITSSIGINKRKIALLRALGARIKEILNIFVLKGIIVGIITFFLSNILTILGINLVNNYITQEVFFYLKPLIFNQKTIVVILSIILVILISLIVPIIRLAKKMPSNLINK